MIHIAFNNIKQSESVADHIHSLMDELLKITDSKFPFHFSEVREATKITFLFFVEFFSRIKAMDRLRSWATWAIHQAAGRPLEHQKKGKKKGKLFLEHPLDHYSILLEQFLDN